MKFIPRFPSPIGWIVSFGLLAFTLFCFAQRLKRIEELSALPTWSVATPEKNPNYITGYANDERQLVWPENSAALKRLIERLQLAATKTASAPHAITGDKLERSALYFNPISFVLLGLLGGALLARTCGARSAQLFVVFLSVYPLCRLFVPGRIGFVELFTGLDWRGTQAPSLWEWFQQDGVSSALFATALPLVLIVALGWQALREKNRVSFIVTSCAILAVGAACGRVSLFALAELTLALAVAIASRSSAWWWCGIVTLLPSWAALAIALPSPQKGEFTSDEWHGLVTRDLAHWLATREQGGVTLASPQFGADLAYSGNLGAIGAPRADGAPNDTLLRICESTTAEEAQRLIEAHHIRFLVFPTWDPYFRSGGRRSPRAFIEQLHQWNLPTWLRPLPYLMPALPGQEAERVIVFSVVGEQDEPTATANLVEYFLETGQLERAIALQPALDRFPTDLSALVAEIEIALAQNPHEVPRDKVNSLAEAVRAQADETLIPDQRVQLALILSRIGSDDLARSVAQACAATMTKTDLLMLSPRDLLRFAALCHYYGIAIADPATRDFVWRLLPPDAREKINGR